MSAAVSFVEYLFTGILAIPWLLLILPEAMIQSLSKTEEALLAVVLIPILYALGMLIDFCSGWALGWAKERIRRNVRALYPSPRHLTSKPAAIYAVAPELGMELSVRSTRDRVARGILSNLLFLAAVVSVTSRDQYLPFSRMATLVLVLLIAGIAFRAWWEFQYLSTEFKYKAIRVLDELGKLDGRPAPNPGPQADG